MNRTLFRKSILFVLPLLLTYACSSTRKLASPQPQSATSVEATSILTKSVENSQTIRSVMGKATFRLQFAGKGERSVGGSVRMVKGQGIQISVAPLLGFELFRAELTPEGIMLIDRMNRQFVKADYEELSQRLHTVITYESLQSLFFNELFIVGRQQLSPSLLRRFKADTGGNTVQFTTDQNSLHYVFDFQKSTAQLVHTALRPSASPYELTWNYGNFDNSTSKGYPKDMEVRFDQAGKISTLTIELSRLQLNEELDLTFGVSSRYKEIAIDDLMNKIQDKL